MVDTHASRACGSNVMGVQVPPSVLRENVRIGYEFGNIKNFWDNTFCLFNLEKFEIQL